MSWGVIPNHVPLRPRLRLNQPESLGTQLSPDLGQRSGQGVYGAGYDLGSTAGASGVRRAPSTQQAVMGSPAATENLHLVVLRGRGVQSLPTCRVQPCDGTSRRSSCPAPTGAASSGLCSTRTGRVGRSRCMAMAKGATVLNKLCGARLGVSEPRSQVALPVGLV